jgi:hypothetical protein
MLEGHPVPLHVVEDLLRGGQRLGVRLHPMLLYVVEDLPG